jgi:hypothetical protein
MSTQTGRSRPTHDALTGLVGRFFQAFWLPTYGRGTGRGSSSLYGAIMVFVKQAFQVGIVLLLLLAIFGVLLTPDPSDDPAGLTVRPDKGRLLVTSLLVIPAVSLPPLTPASRIIFSGAQIATTIAKRDLICTRLC